MNEITIPLNYYGPVDAWALATKKVKKNLKGIGKAARLRLESVSQIISCDDSEDCVFELTVSVTMSG